MFKKSFEFSELSEAPLIPNAIYKGGQRKSVADDPISKLLNVGNAGGIRTKKSKNGQIAYIVIISNSSNKDKYPNSFDEDSNLLSYYGDQYKVNIHPLDTKPKGNLNLKNLFELVYSPNYSYSQPYPIFYFEKVPNSGRDHIFKGIAYPFVKNEDLDEVCKIVKFNNIENYIFKFTVDNINDVSREWIIDLQVDSKKHTHAPQTWKDFLVELSDMTSLNKVSISMTPSILNSDIDTEEAWRQVKVRIGQSKIRKTLLSQIGYCQICRLEYDFFLVASHIVPWSKSQIDKLYYEKGTGIRGDLNNVLLLCATHDKLFDSHNISFDKDGKILISRKIKNDDFYKLSIDKDIKIKIKEEQEEYMVTHRNTFEEKDNDFNL